MIITFDMLKNKYFNYLKLKLKNSTYQINTRKMNLYIFEYFKNTNIFDLTTKDYLNWKIYIDNMNFRYNYKSSLHYCFSDFLKYCMMFYGLKENISKTVGNFKNNEIKKRGNIWNLKEYKKFIKTVDNSIYNTLFDLLFFTGVRKGEALALTFNDFDKVTKTIIISKNITRELDKNKNKIITSPKTTTSQRIITIDNHLCKKIEKLKMYYIKNYKDFTNNFYIFGGKKSISFTTLERIKNNYCKLAKVTQITIHEFRHSHTCLLYANGVPLEEISKRLGHANISMTTDTYLKNLPRKEKRVVKTLHHLRFKLNFGH